MNFLKNLAISSLIINLYCFHVSYACAQLEQKKIICIKQNARLLSEEFSEHLRDAEIKSIYIVFMITSFWLLCALLNTRDLWYYNFQAILACSEKSSENSSESNLAFCLMQIIFFQSRSRAYET